jgi:hypothetical protein
MKKLFLMASIAFGLTAVSCAKDRTCSCTDSNSKNANTQSYKVNLIGATKAQAKANCLSTEYTEDGTTYKSDCKLD